MVTFVAGSEALAAVDGFVSSWIAKGIRRKASFLTEDFTLWNNRYKVTLSKPVAVKYFDWLKTVMGDNRYYDIRRYLSPTGAVQQHLTSYETAQGKFRDIPMLLIFTTRGSKVARCEEYVDSTGLPSLEWPEGTEFF